MRRLHFAEKMGIKAIARELGLARNTVRDAVRSTAPPKYEREPAGSRVMPPVAGMLADSCALSYWVT